MKKTYHIIGAIFAIAFGSLLHFVFEWSNNNPIVGTFSAVNESTWEHIKLLIVPMVLYTIFEYFKYGKKYKNFFQVKFLSLLIGMVSIAVLYYSYKGIVGRHYVWLDIVIFFIAAILAYWFSYKKLGKNKYDGTISKILSILGIILIVVLAIVFTFSPPEIDLFYDASKRLYGIPK